MKRPGALSQMKIMSLYYGMYFQGICSLAIVISLVFNFISQTEEALNGYLVAFILFSLAILNAIFIKLFYRNRIAEKYRRFMKVLPKVDDWGNPIVKECQGLGAKGAKGDTVRR
jgi:uncharacterized membrane protein